MRLSKRHIKEENYIETLSIVCTRVMKFKTEFGRFNELDRIYETLHNIKDRADDYEEDYFMNIERVYTAVYMAIEAEE